jgi:hypothetical protein
MRLTLALALAALLAACTTQSGPPRVVTQTVSVPIATPCTADPGQKPPLADPDTFAKAVGAAPDIFAVAQAYAEAHMQDADWIARLEAANAGCRTVSK